MITHQAACNHMLWMQSEHPLGSDDCVLQKTPFSFDASVWEFYAPLLAGARVTLAPPHAHQESRLLLELIAQHGVTVLQLVPSMLKAILDENKLENCRNLKRLFCGGEVLPSELAARFLDRVDMELYNLYGPTEATIDATCNVCRRTTTSGHSVSIGRPITNTQVFLLDSHLQPVPVGVTGEIYIGGKGLARGYLNRPDLTAEKFIANPFSNDANSRLYRTGDFARYLPDGNIEFLGRIDDQIKIRGYRIGLHEIELALTQHPAVSACAVSVHEDSPETKRLVAHIIAATPAHLSSGQLRVFLKEKLPEYMVPNVFVFLDFLPLTPSGKVDRCALPVPDRSRPELAAGFAEPSTPTEALLAKIWSKVLRIERVGIHDNFFELGGHSLLATRVISRIEEVFRVELALRAVFETPTVASLAQHIEALRCGGTVNQGVEHPVHEREQIRL
jgi:acyl-coenzyme A synthetase/AMP-(fatty) acid ligase/acyl carrier protein